MAVKKLLALAQSLGIEASGLVNIDLALSDPLCALHFAAYDAYLAEQKQGTMAYLERSQLVRKNPRLLFAPAQSVFVGFVSYSAQPLKSSAPLGLEYGRYLRGPDYHTQLGSLGDSLFAQLAQDPQDPTISQEALLWKTCVDSAPVLERFWAHMAGIGFIGKNGMLIHPQFGSYGFLLTILTNLKTQQGPKPLKTLCGSCTRCLNDCPTQAFDAPFILNPKRCIAYHTLESKTAIPQEIAQKIDNKVAGCDICQEVCPFNTKATKQSNALVQEQQSPLGTLTELSMSLTEALALTEPEFKKMIAHSALSRIKFCQFSRNLAVVALNKTVQTPDMTDSLRPLIGQHISYLRTLKHLSSGLSSGPGQASALAQWKEAFPDLDCDTRKTPL
jgi:epoxyqueuosine reductase